MSFLMAERNEVEVEDVGVSTVSVPNNNIAKLMYYLQSLSGCLDYSIPTPYTDDGNYYNLSIAQKKDVVTLAVLLSEVLLDKVIFIVEDNNPLLNGKSNTFLKITKAKTVMAAATNLTETILIGESKVNVFKIMIFTKHWFKRFYLDPLESESYRLNSSITKHVDPVVVESPANTTSEIPTLSTGSWCAFCIGIVFYCFWSVGTFASSIIILNDESLDPCSHLQKVCLANEIIYAVTFCSIGCIKRYPGVYGCCAFASICASVATSVIVGITYFGDSCSQANQNTIISLLAASCAALPVLCCLGSIMIVVVVFNEDDKEKKQIVV